MTWQRCDALRQLSGTGGPDNYLDGPSYLATPQLNVVLAWQKIAPVRYTNLNEANIRLQGISRARKLGHRNTDSNRSTGGNKYYKVR